MSSTGIRKRRTTDDRADDTLKQVEDSYIRKAKRFTDKARQETGNVGPAAIGGGSIPGASYLPISGKYGMIGSIAFNPTLVAIDDGRIDITPDQSGSSKDSSYILVTAQGSPDDLRFIDGAGKNGQIFWLQGTLTQIINLKAATISGIDTISGLGTVTVITTTNHNLSTNDKINILATTNFNVNDVTVTVTNPTTFTYSATGNITPESAGFVQNGNFVTPTGDDVILDGTQSLNGVPMIPIIFDPTVAGNGAWRPAQIIGGGGGSISFPILYPQDDFGDQGAVTLNVDISGTTGQNKTVRMTGDVGFTFTNPPGSTVLEEVWFTFEQDGVGNHSITTTPTGLKNAGQLDSLLDKTANAKTTFHFITEDGGVTYRGELVDLVSGGGNGEPPFEYGITLIATTTGNVVLDLDPGSNGEGQHFIFTNDLTGNVDITFSNTPPNGFSKPFIIEYSFGGTVFDVTFNDPTDVTPIPGKINSTTKLSGYVTNNGGIVASIFTMTSTAGSGGGSDVTGPGSSTDNAIARFDGATGKIIQNSGITVSDNDDMLGIDRIQLSGGTTSATSVNDVVWYIDPSGDLISNVNVGDGWGWSVQNLLKASFIGGVFEVQDANSSSFSRIVNHISPVAPGAIGAFELSADNDSPSQLTMAFYAGSIVDVTTGGSGSAQIGVAQNGVQNDFIRINDSNDGNITFLSNLILGTNFTQFSEISLPANPAANAGLIYLRDVAGTTTPFFLDSSGTESSMIAGGAVPSAIIDVNSSLTILDGAAPSRLRLVIDGTVDPNIEWHPDATFYSANTANWATEYFRNTGSGVNGQIITTTHYEGNSTTSVQREFVTELTTMKTATNALEDGQYTLGLFSKGSNKTAYITEGGGGLVNTNILHSLFGSMILKSDQTEEEAILRLSRNDTIMTVDDVAVGTIQFEGEDSAGNSTIYGNATVEAADVTSGSENGRFGVDLIDTTAGPPVRMIEANTLSNTIIVSPTSSISYTFNTSGLLFPNGFLLDNTDSSTTTLDVPSGDVLSFTDGGTEVGKYDGGDDNWVFNPDNDVQLSPTEDIDLTPGDDIVMNPGGVVLVSADLDMSGTNTIDMGTSAGSTNPFSTTADGFFQIKLNGTTKFVPFFDSVP